MWVTVLAAVVLGIRFPELVDEWAMLARKANRWFRSQCKSCAVDPQAVIDAARALIKH